MCILLVSSDLQLPVHSMACECYLYNIAAVACDEGEFRTRDNKKQVEQCINGQWVGVVCSPPASTLTPTSSSTKHLMSDSTTMPPTPHTEPTEDQAASSDSISLRWYRVTVGVFGVLVLVACPGFLITCGISLHQHKQIQLLNVNSDTHPGNTERDRLLNRRSERRFDLHISNMHFREDMQSRQPEQGNTEQRDTSPMYESISGYSNDSHTHAAQGCNGYDNMAREFTIRRGAQAP